MSHDRFDALVARHHGEVYRYLLIVTGSVGDARELSQETFVQAFRTGRWPDPGPGARPWLFAIATGLSRSRRRSRRRPVGRPIPDGHGQPPMAVAMMRLPAEQRIALALRKLHDFDYEGIGRMLGCSSRSARERVMQAFRTLSAVVLSDEFPEYRSVHDSSGSCRSGRASFDLPGARGAR